MGTHAKITSSSFHKQGAMLTKRVECCFLHDVSKFVEGVVLRDDVEEPFRRIIHLDDGRIELDTECQLRPTER